MCVYEVSDDTPQCGIGSRYPAWKCSAALILNARDEVTGIVRERMSWE